MANNKKILVLSLVLAVIVAAFGVAYNMLMPRGQSGSKTITVEVRVDEESEGAKLFTIQTDEAYLGQALKDEKLIGGSDSEFGFFITTVDGVTADDSRQQWWCILQDGADVFTGVDMTPIQDGDKFELILKTGY